MYGSHEINLLFRVRYLIEEDQYTIGGVRLRLWQETEQIDPDLRAGMAEIRDALVLALSITRVLC